MKGIRVHELYILWNNDTSFTAYLTRDILKGCQEKCTALYYLSSICDYVIKNCIIICAHKRAELKLKHIFNTDIFMLNHLLMLFC